MLTSVGEKVPKTESGVGIPPEVGGAAGAATRRCLRENPILGSAGSHHAFHRHILRRASQGNLITQ